MSQAPLEQGNMRVSLRRLEVFCIVVEVGGVTRAAEHLYVAQPAVSSQIRGLEEWLSVKLFFREGGRLLLTDAGERTYRWAKEMLFRTQELQREMASLGEGTQGAIAIAASIAAGTYLIPPVLMELRAARPRTEITLEVSQPQHVLASVEVGRADLAVVSWDGRDVPPQLEGEHLHSEEIILVASPDGPPEGDVVDVAHVAALPEIDVPTNVTWHRMLDIQLRRQGVRDRNVVIRLGHGESIKRMVRDHRLVAYQPRYVVAESLRRGEVREVEVTGLDLEEHLWLFMRAGKPSSPLIDACVDALREWLPPRRLGLPSGTAIASST